MSSIKQQMNFLIHCHPIWSYLILSNQLESLLTKRLSLIIFLPIMSHLPQFLIASHLFSNVSNRKTNTFERDWSKFNREEFTLEYFSVDWPHTLKVLNNNINASFQNFYDCMNNILHKHAPFKKITKCKLKFRTKPRITPALQKSISIKNKSF